MSIASKLFEVDTSSLELESLTTLHWIGIYLAGTSALVHLVFGVLLLRYGNLASVRYLLITGSFVAGLGLLFADYRRRELYLAGVAFTLVQIVGWYVVKRPLGSEDIGPAVLVDKPAQIALIVVLLTLYRWDW